MIVKVVLSKFLYLIANWTSYPKSIKEALTILKSPLKLLITSFIMGSNLIGTSRKSNKFLKVQSAPWLPSQQICILIFSCNIRHSNSWYFYRFAHNYFENFIKDHKNDFNILLTCFLEKTDMGQDK